MTATRRFHTDHHHVQFCFQFTFFIPCIIIQYLQFGPRHAHSFIKVTILQHSTCYMFWASLAHHQGAHNWTKHFLRVAELPTTPQYVKYM